jgi:outer membrane biosynthesis protein TonB
MITADRVWLKFIVSGCGSVEQVQTRCEGQQCSREVLSSTRMDRPHRLKTTDDIKWVDPAHPDPSASPMTPLEVQKVPAIAESAAASVASAEQKKVIGIGRRLSDINAPAHKPTLPKEINRAGTVVLGLYKICVGADGNVQAVSVIRSALPGGLDAHWIARIETWKYASYTVDGKPVPFCHPARIEVRSQH